MPTILKDLTDELVGYVEGLADVSDRYFQIIDLDDMKQRLDISGDTRIGVGVAYGGSSPTQREHGASNAMSRSSMMIDISFHVIVSYWYNNEDSEDTKRKAFDLLDNIREKILGQSSTQAGRAWEFVSEVPLNSDGESGTIYYMQTWKVRSSQSSL